MKGRVKEGKRRLKILRQWGHEEIRRKTEEEEEVELEQLRREGEIRNICKR